MVHATIKCMVFVIFNYMFYLNLTDATCDK